MIGYPEAVTIVGCFFATGWTIVKLKPDKSEFCKSHGKLTSDIASIKSAIVDLAVYIMKEAEQEGRNLQQEIIDAMMNKKRNK